MIYLVLIFYRRNDLYHSNDANIAKTYEARKFSALKNVKLTVLSHTLRNTVHIHYLCTP